MLYLSKGLITKPCKKEQLVVTNRGTDYSLKNSAAVLWLGARYGADKTSDKSQLGILENLYEKGLVEVNSEENEVGLLRILENCVICKSKYMSCLPLNKQEGVILKWISKAGGKLTASELILLTEKNIKPVATLLGKHNWHKLINTIYSTETIFDGILESKMEKSSALKPTLDAILGLLKKKRILLV